jgi:molybdopterin converting factor small subunit
MRIVVQFHAQAVGLAGARETGLEVSPAATCRDVKVALAAAHPELERLLPSSVLATDAEYLADAAEVGQARTLHLIPPVSGG